MCKEVYLLNLRLFLIGLLLFQVFSSLGYEGNFNNQSKGSLIQDTVGSQPYGIAKKTNGPIKTGVSPANEAVIVADDGLLKIFFINRPGEANKIKSMVSRDAGVTWGDDKTAFELPGEAYYALQVIPDSENNLVSVFHLFDEGPKGYRGRHLDLWVNRKEKEKNRWGNPHKIFEGYVGSIRGFIELKNRLLLLAFAKAVPERENPPEKGAVDFGWNEIVSLYSDDGGETWTVSENEIKIPIDNSKPTRYGGVEPAIMELEDGRIWMLIRTTHGKLYESYSKDGGKNWKTAKPTAFISSDSPAAFLRLSNKKIILFWNSNYRWDDPNSYAIGGREVLHAAISSDEGITWKGFREVLKVDRDLAEEKGDRGTSYPSAVETKDGKVVLVTGQGQGKSIVVIDPDWLEEDWHWDDFSDGEDQWSFYGRGNLSGVLAPGTKDPVLWIRRSLSHPVSDTESVWNFPMAKNGVMDLELKMNAGSNGISMALTDHFSIAGDTLASRNGVLHLEIASGDILGFTNNDRSINLRLSWDTERGEANIYLGGEFYRQVKLNKKPVFGVNYLRLGINGDTEDLSGYEIRSAKMNFLE